MNTLKAHEGFNTGAIDYYPSEIGNNQDYIEGNLTVTGTTSIGKSFLPTSQGNIEIIPTAEKDGKIKIGDSKTSHIQLGSPQTRVALGKVIDVSAEKMQADKFNLGNKWQLSGVGDRHGNDDWLRFFNKDGNDYYGGIATGKLYVQKDVSFDSANTNLKGGKSVHNPHNWNTHFPWSGDGKNYIRGDTELRGNMTMVGNLQMQNEGAFAERKFNNANRYGVGQFQNGAMRMYTAHPTQWNDATLNLSVAQDNGSFDDVVKVDNKGNMNVKGGLNTDGHAKVGKDMSVAGKFFVGAKGFDTNWNWFENGSDAYWFEKVNRSGDPNASTLRLTMNDDPDEAFEIYGRSCLHGVQCKGPGERKHYFGVDGTALHTGQVCVNNQCLTENDIRKIKTKI
jgi:hypothetical protein